MRSLVLCFTLWVLAAAPAHAEAVARVNGQEISAQDLTRALQEFAAQRGIDVNAVRRSPEFSRLRAALLQSLVERELLWQAAQAQHRADDAQVAEALARVRTQLGGQQRLQRALQAQGMDEAALRERLRQDLSIQAYLQQQVYAEVQVSPAEVEAFYRDNVDQFISPDLLHVRDILITGNTDQARAEAEKLYQKLRQGADFAQLAAQHSADVSARHGGDLGYLNAEDLGPELAPVVAALGANEIAAPHAGPEGMHLLRLEARKPGLQAPLEEVRSLIRDSLLENRRDAALRARVEQLRQSANVERSP